MTANTMPRTASSSPTMHIDVNGTRFAYREFGPATGVPVLFLHHFTATIDDWDPRVIDGIAAKRPVIVFDNRGVGGSTGRTPTSVATMADDAITFIRTLDLAHRLPNASLRIYPDAGHGGVFQHHQHFVRQVLEFLA